MKQAFALILTLASLAAAEPRKQGSPLENLPKNIEVLTHFGERADFSPDNTEVAFMPRASATHSSSTSRRAPSAVSRAVSPVRRFFA